MRNNVYLCTRKRGEPRIASEEKNFLKKVSKKFGA